MPDSCIFQSWDEEQLVEARKSSVLFVAHWVFPKVIPSSRCYLIQCSRLTWLNIQTHAHSYYWRVKRITTHYTNSEWGSEWLLDKFNEFEVLKQKEHANNGNSRSHPPKISSLDSWMTELALVSNVIFREVNWDKGRNDLVHYGIVNCRKKYDKMTG